MLKKRVVLGPFLSGLSGLSGVACLACLACLAGVLLVSAVSCTDAESEALLASLSLEDFTSYWAVIGKNEEGDNFIHPVVRFRVANGAEQEVGYIQAMAVFKRELLPDEPWGNAFTYSVSDEPIKPGEASDLVTLRSDKNIISKDAPAQMFVNEKWEEVTVEIFVRVGPSSWQNLGQMQVPKQIGAPGLEKFLSPDTSEDTTVSPNS